jgi:catechol 1,2-dioxygenase
VITGPDDVTAAALAEVDRADNPRTKELLAAGVKHLHAFVRETNLTETEFQHPPGSSPSSASSATTRTTRSC